MSHPINQIPHQGIKRYHVETQSCQHCPIGTCHIGNSCLTIEGLKPDKMLNPSKPICRLSPPCSDVLKRIR